MTRESRANLIFIAILVPLLIPGFLILMNKRLSDPNPTPNHLPHPAPHEIAYIQPLPAPPLPRKEPREAREWVAELARQRLPETSDVLGYLRENAMKPPLVSDRFVTQLVVIDAASPSDIHLLRWDADALPEQQPTVTVDFETGSAAAAVRKIEPIDVPKNVRHALQNVGYVDPPQRVWWIVATYEPSKVKHNGAKAIRLTTHVKGKTVQEVINLLATASTPSIEVQP